MPEKTKELWLVIAVHAGVKPLSKQLRSLIGTRNVLSDRNVQVTPGNAAYLTTEKNRPHNCSAD
jgi:hypothetical protein